MKILKIVVVGLLAFGFAACSAVEEQVVSALFRDYVSAQTALANDNFPEARQALMALAKDSDEKIQALAQEVADCEDIETARKKFKPLSEVISEMELPQGFVVAFCPMADGGKGAPWVQTKGEIRNPYYGAKMLTCGEITKP